MSIPITRKGDLEEGHSCPTIKRRKGHFGSVFANGINVSGAGHKNTSHTYKPGIICIAHGPQGLKPTTRSVFAEGILVGRIGDLTCVGADGPVKVVGGSPNVIVGS